MVPGRPRLAIGGGVGRGGNKRIFFLQLWGGGVGGALLIRGLLALGPPSPARGRASSPGGRRTLGAGGSLDPTRPPLSWPATAPTLTSASLSVSRPFRKGQAGRVRVAESLCQWQRVSAGWPRSAIAGAPHGIAAVKAVRILPELGCCQHSCTSGSGAHVRCAALEEQSVQRRATRHVTSTCVGGAQPSTFSCACAPTGAGRGGGPSAATALGLGPNPPLSNIYPKHCQFFFFFCNMFCSTLCLKRGKRPRGSRDGAGLRKMSPSNRHDSHLWRYGSEFIYP